MISWCISSTEAQKGPVSRADTLWTKVHWAIVMQFANLAAH